MPLSPALDTALLRALAAVPAWGGSPLFPAPRLAANTKPRYFCCAASGPNASRLSNATKTSPLLGFIFAPVLLALDPPPARGPGVPQHPNPPHAGTEKPLPAPRRPKTIRHPPASSWRFRSCCGNPPTLRRLNTSLRGGAQRRIPSCASAPPSSPSLARVGAADSSARRPPPPPTPRRRGIHRAASLRGAALQTQPRQQTKATPRRSRHKEHHPPSHPPAHGR